MRATSNLLDHPEINNGYKSDLVIGITSPKAPEAFRREVGWCYSQGAPRVFRGDLFYWGTDHDLGDRASEIDTSQTRAFLLTGEYDAATTPEMSKEVAGQIKGATYRTMKGLGHFPMSEDPERFYGYIEPVLAEIVGDQTRLGAPNGVPVWFEWDGERIRMFSSASHKKIARLEKDPRASLLVAREVGEPEAWVAVDGVVPITEEAVVPLMERLAARYWDDEDPAVAKAHAETVELWRRAAARLRVLTIVPDGSRSYRA